MSKIKYIFFDCMETIIDLYELPNQSDMAEKLSMNFWEPYKSKCYIKSDIKEILCELAGKYKLAVVSNFMLKDGIEELLEINGLSNAFDFITTSIKIGWRKPDPKIYEISIATAGCNVEEIIFIGDEVENDYFAPRRLGMKAIFLDKECSRLDIDKVRNFKRIER